MKTTVGEQPSGPASCVTDNNVGDNAVKKGKQNLEKKKKGKKIFNDKSKESKKGKLLSGSNPLVQGVFPGDTVNQSSVLIFSCHIFFFELLFNDILFFKFCIGSGGRGHG